MPNLIVGNACNRCCGHGWVEGDDWVEDEDGATKRGAALTSDGLPDVCFFGGGASLREPVNFKTWVWSIPSRFLRAAVGSR